MDEKLFESELCDLLNMLDVFSEVDENCVFVDSVNTFEDKGILTSDRGLVIKLSDKTEFQLIIKQVLR